VNQGAARRHYAQRNLDVIILEKKKKIGVIWGLGGWVGGGEEDG
jgi:ribulose 1,5-bisphosphate synthetase/thiazole synthase